MTEEVFLRGATAEAVEVYEVRIILVDVGGLAVPLISGSVWREGLDDRVRLQPDGGMGSVLVVSGKDFVVSVSSAVHYPVTVTARLGPGTVALTDDAFSTLTWEIAGTAAELRVTVGQLTEAAQDRTPDDVLRRSASADGVVGGGLPAGVLINPQEPSVSAAHWRDLVLVDSNGHPTVDGSTARISYRSDRMLGDPTKTGVSRLNIEAATVTPFQPLDTKPYAANPLRWLTYGPDSLSGYASGRQFLVAVWTPLTPDSFMPARKAAGGSSALPVDVVAYFSPNADRGDFRRVRYPFGAVLDAGRIIQPYIDLGYRHLFSGQGIVPQLLTAGRAPVVVMPINVRGSWGPFGCANGWWRFITELMVYLTRSATAGASIGPAAPGTAVAGRVVIAGFSAGAAIAAGLLAEDSPLDRNLPVVQFGLPGGGRSLIDTTTEIWDFDGSFVGMPPWTSRREAYARWFHAKPKRILRLYHTVSTVGSWRPDSKTELQSNFRKLLATMAPPMRPATTPEGEWLQQWDDRNRRWTIVLFSDSGDSIDTKGYLGGPRGLDPIDAKRGTAGHELVANIAVAHAALLSDLPKIVK